MQPFERPAGSSRSADDGDRSDRRPPRHDPGRRVLTDGGTPEGPADQLVDRSDAEERAEFEAYVSEICDDFTDYWWEYDLDYSPESLVRLDDLVDDNWSEARFQGVEADPEGGFDERAFAGVSRQLGAYYGEVLRQNLAAEWRRTEMMGWAVHVDGPRTSDADGATGEDRRGDEDDGGTETGDGDAVVTNAFQAARESLTEPSSFAASYSRIAERVGGEPVGDVEGGRRITVETPPADADADRFGEAASDLVAAHPEYDLDYSEESLAALDELVRTELFGGEIEVGAMGDDDLATTLERVGSYLGETLVRSRDGVWQYSDDRDTWGVALDAVDRDVEVFLMTMTTLHANGTFTEVTENLDRATGRGGGPGAGDDGGSGRDGGAAAVDADEAVAEQCRERAAEFVADQAAYDLDYSVESLARLDDLAAEELTEMVGTLLEAEAESEGESAADMLVGAAVLPYACYFGEVLRRAYEDSGAAWVDQDGRAVAIPTEGGVVTVDPVQAGAAVAGGEAAFRALYDQVTADL